MSGPLAGLRVLDLGTRIAAPFCAGLLGEQGAEVIKVEQPRGGDFMREIGPFVDAGDNGQYSLFWAVEGRGRKSVTLDLRRPEGQEVFRRLAATADVVVENFRPGTLERWGIAPGRWEPRPVWVRISAFGQDGPYASRVGLDRSGRSKQFRLRRSSRRRDSGDCGSTAGQRAGFIEDHHVQQAGPFQCQPVLHEKPMPRTE